jgi:hypothetical protein
VVFVLDDYHLIDSEPVQASMTFLLRHLPPTYIWCSRHAPTHRCRWQECGPAAGSPNCVPPSCASPRTRRTTLVRETVGDAQRPRHAGRPHTCQPTARASSGGRSAGASRRSLRPRGAEATARMVQRPRPTRCTRTASPSRPKKTTTNTAFSSKPRRRPACRHDCGQQEEEDHQQRHSDQPQQPRGDSSHAVTIRGLRVPCQGLATRHRCRFSPRSRSRLFEEIGDWVDSFEGLWEARLDSLESFLSSMDTAREQEDP